MVTVFSRIFSRLLLLAALCLSSSSFSGCSTPFFDSSTPEVQQLLIGVSARYLQLVAAGDEKLVSEMVYWPEYLDGARFTRVDFHKQFESIRGKWPLEDHPLLNQKVVSVSSRGNYGEVVLEKDPKKMKPGQVVIPKIVIRLIWTGRGWIVSEDNLFGRDKFFSKYSS